MTLGVMVCVSPLTVDSKPFIQVLALWQLDRLPQTSTSKRGLSKLSQLVARGALVRSLRFELASRSRIAVCETLVSA